MVIRHARSISTKNKKRYFKTKGKTIQ
jgi:hypothetical protein